MNNRMINLPRQLLELSVNGSEQEQGRARNELRALLDAHKVINREMGLMQFVEAHPVDPAVELQEPAAWLDLAKVAHGMAYATKVKVGDRQSALYTAPPQLAEQQATAEPVRLTAVGVLRDDGDGGLEPEWLLEGGTAELWAGATLLIADNAPDLCAEDGSAELYRLPPGGAA